eukprot:scaffold5908_cov152-Skeletonema_marinoi.AAC.7
MKAALCSDTTAGSSPVLFWVSAELVAKEQGRQAGCKACFSTFTYVFPIPKLHRSTNYDFEFVPWAVMSCHVVVNTNFITEYRRVGLVPALYTLFKDAQSIFHNRRFKKASKKSATK